MAELTVNKAIEVADLKNHSCKTQDLHIHGYTSVSPVNNSLDIYGTDKILIIELIKEKYFLKEKIIAGFPYLQAEVIWAVREEMARTIEDVLARRIRLLFLDAKAAIEAAPKVAELMAGELGCDEEWKQNQLKSFYAIAKNYLVKSYGQQIAIN
ncbi:MAG: glycerol-3-phosphate dehydrogenase C-terminal domain-containing protein [Ginsengibacter sp.]